MTCDRYVAGKYVRQNDTEKEEKGNFCSPGRITVHEGTAPQSRSRLVEGPVLDQKPQSIYRSSVDKITPLPADHKPFTSVHRPEQPPASHVDLPGLRAHQEAMLSPRQKRKHKRGE
jgi:hypothetical protein